MTPIYKSRKFWAALAGIVFATLGSRGGVDEAGLTAGVAVIISYILGTALEGLRK